MFTKEFLDLLVMIHSSSYSELILAKKEPTILQRNIKTRLKETYKFEKRSIPSSNHWHFPSSEE